MNKKLLKAREEHNKWLAERNLLPTQIKARLGRPKPLSSWDAKPPPKPNNSSVYTAIVNSIWEKIRKGEESQHTIAEIHAKAKRIAPAFSKGAYTYIGEDSDVIKNLGKKNSA